MKLVYVANIIRKWNEFMQAILILSTQNLMQITSFFSEKMQLVCLRFRKALIFPFWF